MPIENILPYPFHSIRKIRVNVSWFRKSHTCRNFNQEQLRKFILVLSTGRNWTYAALRKAIALFWPLFLEDQDRWWTFLNYARLKHECNFCSMLRHIGCLPFTWEARLVEIVRKNFSWKITFGARAFHWPGDRKLLKLKTRYLNSKVAILQPWKAEKCKWSKMDGLKRSNRSKRTTFSSEPFISKTFWLGDQKRCSIYIYPELPELLCKW